MEEMTRLFGLDFQLLHDVVLMALAVFFLFLFMLILFHTKTVSLLFGNSLRFIMPSDLPFTISSILCEFEYIFINGTLQGLTL